MSTTIYFTNLDSDVSGYKLALVNERNPAPPSAVVSAITATTSSGSNIQMTLTSGGTTAKWITKPLSVAVTIASVPYMNLWGLEDAGTTNSGFQMRVAKYSAGAQGSDLLTSSFGTELGTTAAINQWVASGGISSTAFAVGDRLVILPYINNVGTMAVGTATMTYDGAASNATGDSYIVIQEDLRVSKAQVGSGTTPTVRAVGVSYFYNIQDVVQQAVNVGLISSNTAAQQIIDEATNQMALV